MTLAERIAARRCAVLTCPETKVEGSLVCREHLGDMWANRLQRQQDGTFVTARRFAPKDFTRSAA